MYNRVLPNFKEITDTLCERDEVTRALKEIYHLGYSAGYMDGKDFGWVAEMEKSFYRRLSDKKE